MTCLELMKKLRPDLSERAIIENFCPEAVEIHMQRVSPKPGLGINICGRSCRECWNKEVDEEMVYFQDEAVEGVYKHNFKLACENFDSAMELVYKKEREVAELKEKNKELEKHTVELIEENEKLKHALDDSLAERDSFRRENEFFKEKIKELKSELTPWITNDGC